jgi:hypothetical protein
MKPKHTATRTGFFAGWWIFSLWRRMGVLQLYKRRFKKQYKGKPTKKYKKVLQMIKAGGEA